jgi:alpha-ribazole phosphatase/probable phosphoglycerate mutase
LGVNKVFLKEHEKMKDQPTRLYLVRHGELVTSKEWRYVGQMDVELNDAGKQQIKKLSSRLSSEQIDRIFSSDLNRTIESAEIIGNKLGIINEPISEFREIDLGVWEGLTLEEIEERFPEDLVKRSEDIKDFRIINGESFSDLNKRVIPKVMDIIKNNAGKRILVVAHGGVNRVIIADALGLSIDNIPRLEQNYACLNIIDYYKTGPVVRLINEIISL